MNNMIFAPLEQKGLPSISKKSKVKSPKQNMIEELLNSELLASQFAICELASHLGYLVLNFLLLTIEIVCD